MWGVRYGRVNFCSARGFQTLLHHSTPSTLSNGEHRHPRLLETVRKSSAEELFDTYSMTLCRIMGAAFDTTRLPNLFFKTLACSVVPDMPNALALVMKTSPQAALGL